MPFTSPMLLGSSEFYPAVIEFDPIAGSGGNAGTYFISTITEIRDIDNYFGAIDGDANYDYIEFSTFGTYEFAVIENTLSASANISSINIIELAAEGPASPFAETSIFTVYTAAGGAQFPTATVSISDLASYVDALCCSFVSGPGSRTITGTVKIAIKKL